MVWLYIFIYALFSWNEYSFGFQILAAVFGCIWHLITWCKCMSHTPVISTNRMSFAAGKTWSMNHVITAVPLRLHGALGVRYAGSKRLPILLSTSVFKVPLWGSSSGHSCRHRPRRATALSETQVDEAFTLAHQSCSWHSPYDQKANKWHQVTTCR